jgi:hypothetical protein
MDAVRKIPWVAYWNGGHFIVHTPRWSFKLRGPTDTPYFSERYGRNTRRIQLGRGWRLVIETRK